MKPWCLIYTLLALPGQKSTRVSWGVSQHPTTTRALFAYSSSASFVEPDNVYIFYMYFRLYITFHTRGLKVIVRNVRMFFRKLSRTSYIIVHQALPPPPVTSSPSMTLYILQLSFAATKALLTCFLLKGHYSICDTIDNYHFLFMIFLNFIIVDWRLGFLAPPSQLVVPATEGYIPQSGWSNSNNNTYAASALATKATCWIPRQLGAGASKTPRA